VTTAIKAVGHFLERGYQSYVTYFRDENLNGMALVWLEEEDNKEMRPVESRRARTTPPLKGGPPLLAGTHIDMPAHTQTPYKP
jgi:hypothetical protein